MSNLFKESGWQDLCTSDLTSSEVEKAKEGNKDCCERRK